MTSRKITDTWEISQDKPPITFDGAVLFLKNCFQQAITQDDDGVDRPFIDVLKDMINKNPDKWWVEHHFSWGMGVRNMLRKNGYSEKALGIDNLDDYYIPFVEQACLGKGNNHRPIPDKSN